VERAAELISAVVLWAGTTIVYSVMLALPALIVWVVWQMVR
jgi:hypothetical protein